MVHGDTSPPRPPSKATLGTKPIRSSPDSGASWVSPGLLPGTPQPCTPPLALHPAPGPGASSPPQHTPFAGCCPCASPCFPVAPPGPLCKARKRPQVDVRAKNSSKTGRRIEKPELLGFGWRGRWGRWGRRRGEGWAVGNQALLPPRNVPGTSGVLSGHAGRCVPGGGGAMTDVGV